MLGNLQIYHQNRQVFGRVHVSWRDGDVQERMISNMIQQKWDKTNVRFPSHLSFVWVHSIFFLTISCVTNS